MRSIEIIDNSVDSNIIINPIKQEFGFLPKEESQMFSSKSNTWTNSSPSSQSVVEEKIAFDAATAGAFILPNTNQTPTDYIGIIPYNVPTKIIEKFSTFQFYNLKNATLINLFSDSDNNKKIIDITNGLQSLRIPANVFNSVLTDPTLIEANNDKQVILNYGKYYLIIKPASIDITITGFQEKYHYSLTDIGINNDNNTAKNKRRRIILSSNVNFKKTNWLFESGSDSGRLFGSVVEIWNNGTLKYSKVMAENEFNFINSGTIFNCVLYPDNFGINSSEINIGDTMRIFPRESYFNDIIIEIDYKDPIYNLDQILSYTLNDASRDLKTGLYEVYDRSGLSMDENGIIQGKVINTYQITSTDRYELRKRVTS